MRHLSLHIWDVIIPLTFHILIWKYSNVSVSLIQNLYCCIFMHAMSHLRSASVHVTFFAFCIHLNDVRTIIKIILSGVTLCFYIIALSGNNKNVGLPCMSCKGHINQKPTYLHIKISKEGFKFQLKAS